MRTPRLPAVDWTDAPADLNGLVRFAERRNMVSVHVPSHFKRSLLPDTPVTCLLLTHHNLAEDLNFSYISSKMYTANRKTSHFLQHYVHITGKCAVNLFVYICTLIIIRLLLFLIAIFIKPKHVFEKNEVYHRHFNVSFIHLLKILLMKYVLQTPIRYN
jgi:hypothetical protein